MGSALIIGLIVAAAEVLGRYRSEWRVPLYAGGVAGIGVCLGGLPFAAKLVKLGTDPGAAFWKWWGAGILARLTLMTGAAGVLALMYGGKQVIAAILCMFGVYLAGMFAESAWVAKCFFDTADKKRQS